MSEQLKKQPVIPLRYSSTRGLRVLALLVMLGGVTLGMLIGLLFMASDCEPTRMMDTMSSLSGYISSHKLIIGGSAIAAVGIYMVGASTGLARLFFERVFKALLSPCVDLVPSSPKVNAVESRSGAKNVAFVHQEAVEHIVMQIVAETIEVPLEQIRRTGDFFEYGADSYSLNKVLSLIEQRLQVQIKADDIFDYSMLAQLAALITQRQQQGERQVAKNLVRR